MNKKSAVVICPGRGTYNQSELGYLEKYHPKSERTPELSEFLSDIDQGRQEKDQILISDLDGSEKFKSKLHGTGDNASALIYVCALADYQAINSDEYDIVAVTGNSMGWYLALACAGVLPGRSGFEVVNTMGTLMHTEGQGGQVIYPLVDSHWLASPELEKVCEAIVAELNLEKHVEIHTSIELGGMRVLAGNESGLRALLKKLPPEQDRFPFQLQNHSAFHSPILNNIPEQAKALLNKNMFSMSDVPLVDGRGKIWHPTAFDLDDIYDYTFNHQITQTYDFSAAIDVCLKEFAPDKLIVLGPGTTLGPPIAQEMIKLRWQGYDSKSSFTEKQKADPYLLSMGIEAQRQYVTKS